VNSKRGNLAEKLLRQVARAERRKALPVPRLYAGHTRFATASLSTMDGCPALAGGVPVVARCHPRLHY
jgi:hypothetical protein